MLVKVVWVDDDEVEGFFQSEERGFIVLNCSGSIQACLPAHLKSIEIIDKKVVDSI